MEIIKGNLDDISRPASSEQTGSRVSSVSLSHSDRICLTTPIELVVLSNDASNIQGCFGETITESSAGKPGKDQSHSEVTEGEDSKLLRAFEEMRRLDEILAAKISKEKEIRRQRKELQAKLWQELLNKPEGQSECAHEEWNTKLFLSLEADTGTKEEDNFVPLFETQILDSEHNGDNHCLEQSEKRPGSLTGSFEVSYEDVEGDQFKGSHCPASNSKNAHKNFIKRNIELVSGEVDHVLLTNAEKERLAELLREIDEEEENSTTGADSEEVMRAVSVLTGQGYTPEPSDLEQLIDIDSKICLLLPVEEFQSLQNSYTNLSMSQGLGSKVGWKCDGVRQPGEKVLQDIKERREQETRLQEIQQQLESLGHSQKMTDESPDLTEEQLISLLDECDLTESWSQNHENE
ncbi:fibrous sheath-interacting protein 1 [Melanotaenia boesemani]|uniref:fibrous sheath-interacting protein 1 n=1 Tax=Melanotaenia boesemani TaxID=1250792 RepID=UPI001C05B690|nr:fibrous sheath-interacting protein 1 [Melanotaenia boesemani]